MTPRDAVDTLAIIVGLIAIIRFWKSEAAARRAQIAAENDLKWRVANLETWRREHMIDADTRDQIIKRMDTLLTRIEVLIEEIRKGIR